LWIRRPAIIVDRIVAVVARPFLAFAVTQRLRLGVQQRDREEREHGIETIALGAFLLVLEVGGGGVEPPTFRFSGVTTALVATHLPW
jgi:hypothetical protein